MLNLYVRSPASSETPSVQITLSQGVVGCGLRFIANFLVSVQIEDL